MTALGEHTLDTFNEEPGKALALGEIEPEDALCDERRLLIELLFLPSRTTSPLIYFLQLVIMVSSSATALADYYYF